MNWKIEIHRAKPNPSGKDKSGNTPIASQLLAEWVDIKNVGDAKVDLSTLYLSNREFDGSCQVKTESKIYWEGENDASLDPGEIVRIHTGRNRDTASMDAADQNDVQHHIFAEKGSFVLNNKCGDTLRVWRKNGDSWKKDDEAAYASNPDEGKVLQRIGVSLV